MRRFTHQVLGLLMGCVVCGCEVFTGIEETDHGTPDSGLDSTVFDGDATTDAYHDSVHDSALDTDALDAVIDDSRDAADTGTSDADATEATDGCACTPGDVRTVSGTCPSVGDVQQETCTPTCAWSSPTCVTPSGWRRIASVPPTWTERLPQTGIVALVAGRYLVVYGGQPCVGSGFLTGGWTYDIVTDKWHVMSAPPSSPAIPPFAFATVSTDDSVIVWGGVSYEATGVEYFPASDSWRVLGPGVLGRAAPHGVWNPTARQLLFWGGRMKADAGDVYVVDGVIYDRTADSWSSIAPAPIVARDSPNVLWTGTRLLVYGGTDPSTSSPLRDGALYDPATKAWSTIADSGVEIADVVAVQTNLFLLNAIDVTSSPPVFTSGAQFDLTTASWTAVPPPPSSVLSPRGSEQSWIGDGKIWMWSGGDNFGVAVAGGAVFDPVGLTYASIADPGLLAPRILGFAARTGKSAIIWNGKPASGAAVCLNDGAIFTP
jgi:hypothetical protein